MTRDQTTVVAPRLLAGEDAEQTRSRVRDALSATGEWHERTATIAHNIFALEITADGTVSIAPKDGESYFIILKANAHATLVEHARGNAQVSILIEEGAALEYWCASSGAIKRFACLERDASIDWMDASLEPAAVDNTAYLRGSGADAKFRSLFIAAGAEHHSFHITMIHAAPRTTSHMLTRTALLNESKGTYRGTIRILPHADGCDAYQREDTLLLGDGSKMDAIPILEINNDDVKCSHGVTLGRIDDEKLFYLASRGIPEALAQRIIVQGFFDQLLISMGEHGKAIRERIAQKMASQDGGQ